MTSGVHRLTSLPTGALKGDFFVPQAVISSTEKALTSFRDARSDHEGIVFWGGRETSAGVFIMTAIIPVAEHSPGRVYVSELNVLEVVRDLRRHQLGLVAQVHSHPGADIRHSDGDDRMVVAPFEGMLSIVVPHYAKFGMASLQSCAIHQMQDTAWTLCTSGLESLRVLEELVDLR